MSQAANASEYGDDNNLYTTVMAFHDWSRNYEGRGEGNEDTDEEEEAAGGEAGGAAGDDTRSQAGSKHGESSPPLGGAPGGHEGMRSMMGESKTCQLLNSSIGARAVKEIQAKAEYRKEGYDPNRG